MKKVKNRSKFHEKWPSFAINLPWMASYGSERSFVPISSARDNLVKVSWKSDARKCQNQVTPYFDQLRERCESLWHFILKPLVKSQSCSQLHICQNWRPLKTEWNQGNNKTVGRNQWRRKSPNFDQSHRWTQYMYSKQPCAHCTQCTLCSKHHFHS